MQVGIAHHKNPKKRPFISKGLPSSGPRGFSIGMPGHGGGLANGGTMPNEGILKNKK